MDSIPAEPIITYTILEGDDMAAYFAWRRGGKVGPKPTKYSVWRVVDGRIRNRVSRPLKSRESAERKIAQLMATHVAEAAVAS